jgi:beta-fructofuranosidase
MTDSVFDRLLFARRQYGTNGFDGHANDTNTAKRTTMPDFFYKPDSAWAADFIPFYTNGRFRLFYLLDWRKPTEHGEGTPWYQISTTDFVRFDEHGEMLPRGSREEQDLYVFTGSVIEGEGRYHIFYTGHNPHFRRVGKPEQGVMHAVSDDLYHWTKLPNETFFAPSVGYEPHDWRDPYVWHNEDAGEYWMLLAARRTTGPSRRRGCTALCASKDLRTWEVREPFWDPGLYYTHECPDLFRIGDWWYLVYSTFSERCVTHYRMSRSLSGPWLAPDNDTFDGRAYYAAKTASDGNRRYVFGWNPTRDGERDDGGWQWGGNLVVHEVVQEPDGTLSVRVPETVDDAFLKPLPVSWSDSFGGGRVGDDAVRVKSPESFGCVSAGAMPVSCKIETTLTFGGGTRGCGVMLRSSDDFESAYYIRLEPAKRRLVFDMWPRAGDRPHCVELERPLDAPTGSPVTFKIFVDGSVCVVYANDRIAMNARLYNMKAGNWGVFVNEGTATFVGTRLFGR